MNILWGITKTWAIPIPLCNLHCGVVNQNSFVFFSTVNIFWNSEQISRFPISFFLNVWKKNFFLLKCSPVRRFFLSVSETECIDVLLNIINPPEAGPFLFSHPVITTSEPWSFLLGQCRFTAGLVRDCSVSVHSPSWQKGPTINGPARKIFLSKIPK